MPGSLHHLLSALGSPPGMAEAMHLKPNWSIENACYTNHTIFSGLKSNHSSHLAGGLSLKYWQ